MSPINHVHVRRTPLNPPGGHLLPSYRTSLTSMSFQYARNANPESFLTNWFHWVADMSVTVRIGKIFWLMSLKNKKNDIEDLDDDHDHWKYPNVEIVLDLSNIFDPDKKKLWQSWFLGAFLLKVGFTVFAVWVMRKVIGNGRERRSGQKRELGANEGGPKMGATG